MCKAARHMCLCNIYRHICIWIALSGVVHLLKLWACVVVLVCHALIKWIKVSAEHENSRPNDPCSYRHLYNCNNSPSPHVLILQLVLPALLVALAMQPHSTLGTDAFKVLEPSPQGHLHPIPIPPHLCYLTSLARLHTHLTQVFGTESHQIPRKWALRTALAFSVFLQSKFYLCSLTCQVEQSPDSSNR